MISRNAFLAAALAFSLAAAPAPGRGQEPEKVSLRFGPAEGTRLTYSLSSVVNVDGKSLLGVDLALNADSRGEIRFLAKPSARETVRADLTSPGIDVNIRLPEKVISQKIGTTRGEPLEVVFNRTGRVETIRNPEAVGGGNPFNLSTGRKSASIPRGPRASPRLSMCSARRRASPRPRPSTWACPARPRGASRSRAGATPS